MKYLTISEKTHGGCGTADGIAKHKVTDSGHAMGEKVKRGGAKPPRRD